MALPVSRLLAHRLFGYFADFDMQVGAGFVFKRAYCLTWSPMRFQQDWSIPSQELDGQGSRVVFKTSVNDRR